MASLWNSFRRLLDGSKPLEIEEAEILSNSQRRATIKVLSRREEEEITLTDLSHQIAEFEHGSNYSRAQRKSIYSSIHGAHLEVLNESQIIDYSAEPCLTLSRKPKVFELEDYIEDQPSETSLFHEFDEREEGFIADRGFSALASPRSRFAINYIAENGASEFRDLYIQLAADENGKAVEELEPEEQTRSYVSLKQTHIPQLKEMSVVEADYKEIISPGDNFRALSKHI